jgi:hypothetical protein
MGLNGLALPELSAYDPGVAGEGSLDPMGLAAISDGLANRLVPGLRARMQRFRFVTAMAVGALACETLADELPADEISTPAICFEWIVIEAFVRRFPPGQVPSAVPGSQKARVVTNRGGRLSAGTYLKGPAVFGFNGVYKPFAVDSGITGADLEPGSRCVELVRAWEQGEGVQGFADAVPGTDGGRLRENIRDQVRQALRAGHCATNPKSWLFGQLATSLHPEGGGPDERRALRSLVDHSVHETRAELASLLNGIDDELEEYEILEAIRPRCSASLAILVDAVVAYEQFATTADVAFRSLCAMSLAFGTQPLTPMHAAASEVIIQSASRLPDLYRRAANCMAALDAEAGLEQRLGEFAIPRPPSELVELLFSHHEQVQQQKPPNGKRPWFEPIRDGWVVRGPYARTERTELGPHFIHPVRVGALCRLLEDSEA